ncbi:MAG: flagellar basal body-associated FliL family protein [Pseudomonadota bacterium]
MTQRHPAGERVRVRTPGKYIVLSSLAMALVVAGGVAAIRHAPTASSSSEAPMAVRNIDGEDHVTLPEYLVDLRADRDGRIHYLKLSASLVIDRDGEVDLARLRDAAPSINERFVFFLRQLQRRDFEHEEQMRRLKTEMTRRANLVLGDDVVRDVVITEFVIQ